MKTYKSWILIWVVGLMIGFGLVTASIIMTIGFNAPEYAKASHGKLYFSHKVLPDHTFYPALMTLERARLSVTPDDEKPAMLLELANLRMQSAQDLVDKGEIKLAERTLYKSHLYLVRASKSINDQKNWLYAADLSQALIRFGKLCSTLKEQIHPGDATLFEQMRIENKVATEQIHNLLWSEH